jgi:large subunit ribosomal protein L41
MQPTAVLQRSLRRLALTTKQGPHNYYKGHGTGAMGRHTKWGGYVLDYKKIRTYVCPDLRNFEVRHRVPFRDF